MNITLDSQGLTGVKDIGELTKLLTQIFEKLHSDLRNQPHFLVVTSEEQEIPKTLPPNTIIFKFDPTAVVKTGFYNGDNVQLP
jgi:hypothetical protein